MDKFEVVVDIARLLQNHFGLSTPIAVNKAMTIFWDILPSNNQINAFTSSEHTVLIETVGRRNYESSITGNP